MPISTNRMYVRVRVEPGVKREKVEKLDDLRYRISVREPAERNLANQRVKELLCEAYKVTSGQVRLITGHRSQNKIFDIDFKHNQ